MAQSVARQAVNLQVAGSNPAGGGLLMCEMVEVCWFHFEVSEWHLEPL